MTMNLEPQPVRDETGAHVVGDVRWTWDHAWVARFGDAEIAGYADRSAAAAAVRTMAAQ